MMRIWLAVVLIWLACSAGMVFGAWWATRERSRDHGWQGAISRVSEES